MILACKQALSCGVGVWREEERELSLSSSLHPPTPHERANARRLASSFQEWQGKDFAKGYKCVIFAFWSKSFMRYDRKCSIWRHHMELPEGCIFSLKIHTNEFHVTIANSGIFFVEIIFGIFILFLCCVFLVICRHLILCLYWSWFLYLRLLFTQYLENAIYL